jgi:hypothetical protein
VSDSYYFRRSSRSFTHGFPHSSSSDDHTPYVPPYDGAHIAIDDKRFLASLAGLASAPPLDHSDMSGTTEPSQVSAPEWHDEELDFAGTSHRHSLSSSTSVHHPHPPVLQFPPPPQFQGELTATALYHYSSSFENLVSDHEPSAPSFDAGLPSAPPLEETNIGPSAPPLPDDWDWERDGDGRVQKHQNINLEDDVTAAQQSNFSRASDTMPRADGPSRK